MLQHKIKKFFKKLKYFRMKKKLNGDEFPKELELSCFNNNAFPPNYIKLLNSL